MSTSGPPQPSPRRSTTGLADKNGKVKPSTLKGYKVVANGAIRGPLLIGTRQERADYTESGIAPKGARFIKLLGHIKLTELTTAMIRIWHRTIVEQCGTYTANRAKSHLKSILALAEEDFNVRAPSMPTGCPRPPQAEEGNPERRRTSAGSSPTPRMIPSMASTTPSRSWPARDRRATGPAVERGGLRQQRHSHPPHPGARRLADRDDQDGSRNAGNSDEPDVARDVARVARPLSAQRQGTPSRLSRPRQTARMAEAADRRRRSLALSELPQALLGTGLQAP